MSFLVSFPSRRQVKPIRRLRRFVFAWRLWRKRLVFWLGAIAVGLAASGFAIVANEAQSAFARLVAISAYAPLIVSPLMFALVAWVTARWFPTTVGSGIPQAIAARALRTPASLDYLLGTRVILGKMALCALALLGGASVGREGPTVQVGAAMMLLGARIGGIGQARGILLAGAAAGVAAAFNTPLAGIVFAIEEMARSFEHRNSGTVLMAIVLAAVAAISVLGNYDYFGVVNDQFNLIRDFVPVLLVGVAGGLGGALFARALVDGGKFLRTAGRSFVTRYPALFGAACGLIIALLGLAAHGAVYGTGYQLANDLLHERYRATVVVTIAKFLATTVSNIGAIPGGLFSPSLSVGASLGSTLAAWFPHTPPQLVVLLGMTAYFAGVTQAPITAFVIVLEVTGKGVMPVPLIVTAVVATAISRLFNPVSLYHMLAERFIAQTRVLLTAQSHAVT